MRVKIVGTWERIQGDGRLVALDERGYFRLQENGQLVHHVDYEACFGAIPRGWVVHHVNGQKLQNHPDNLIALPESFHDHLHARIQGWSILTKKQIVHLLDLSVNEVTEMQRLRTALTWEYGPILQEVKRLDQQLKSKKTKDLQQVRGHTHLAQFREDSKPSPSRLTFEEKGQIKLRAALASEALARIKGGGR